MDTCLDCGVDMVHVFIPTSEVQRIHTIKKSPEEVLRITGDIIAYVRDHCDLCMFSAMDATRTDPDYLIQVLRVAAGAGATILNIPDTVGVFSPSAMKRLITRIKSEVDCPLDVHCHNDFGNAVMNACAAVEGGAELLDLVVNGLGDRAGNTNMEETVMALECLYRVDTGFKLEKLMDLSKMVESPPRGTSTAL